jgi:hypothetical protein
LKPGSQDVWEFRLSGLTNLIDYVVPFYLKYVIPFSGKVKEFNTFLEISRSPTATTSAETTKRAFYPRGSDRDG